MDRRGFLATAATAGAVSLTGCLAEAGAMGASARARLTGHVKEPRSIWIRNEADQQHTITVTITDSEGQIVFRDETKIPPNSASEDVWGTTRVGRYTITGETETGVTGTGTMRVCVGYYNTGITIYADTIEIGQAHGDPVAAHCSVAGAR